LGEYGSLPYWYQMCEAAAALPPNFFELLKHPERNEIMQMAFTYKQSKASGEFDRELNPKYQHMVKESAEKIKSARG
jgi:hypothetical protein